MIYNTTEGGSQEKNHNFSMFHSFTSIFERIKENTEIKNLTSLGRFLGVSQQFVSKKKKENIFPVEWAFKVGQHYGLSTDWLMTGKETEKKEREVEKKSFLKTVEEWLQQISEEEPGRAMWFEYKFQDDFPQFVEWEKRKK